MVQLVLEFSVQLIICNLQTLLIFDNGKQISLVRNLNSKQLPFILTNATLGTLSKKKEVDWCLNVLFQNISCNLSITSNCRVSNSRPLHHLLFNGGSTK